MAAPLELVDRGDFLQLVEVTATRAAAEATAAEILAELRDAALAQLSFRRDRFEKRMVHAEPRQLHDLRRRRDLVAMAMLAAERL